MAREVGTIPGVQDFLGTLPASVTPFAELCCPPTRSFRKGPGMVSVPTGVAFSDQGHEVGGTDRSEGSVDPAPAKFCAKTEIHKVLLTWYGEERNLRPGGLNEVQRTNGHISVHFPSPVTTSRELVTAYGAEDV